MSSREDKFALLRLTPAQLHIWKEVNSIDQAWFLLKFLIGIVSVLTVAMITFFALGRGWAASGMSAALDGVFGVCLLKVTDFHYPNQIRLSRVSDLLRATKRAPSSVSELHAGEDQ